MKKHITKEFEVGHLILEYLIRRGFGVYEIERCKPSSGPVNYSLIFGETVNVTIPELGAICFKIKLINGRKMLIERPIATKLNELEDRFFCWCYEKCPGFKALSDWIDKKIME